MSATGRRRREMTRPLLGEPAELSPRWPEADSCTAGNWRITRSLGIFRGAARMSEDKYKVELVKYKAMVAELEAAEVELVLESHQDEQRRGHWLKWYDAALAKSPPDERDIEAYMAAVEQLRNRSILRKAAFERIRDNFDNLKQPRRAKRTWWDLMLKS